MQNRKVSLGTFDCSQQDIDAVVSAMKSGYLSAGKQMDEFEAGVADICNKNYGIMVNSGQAALEVALIAMKYKLQKQQLKVLVPTTTYAATLWAILNTNNIPVFCDIGSDYNIDNNKAKALDYDVAMPVHLCGKTAHFISDKPIIEDACEAFGNLSVGYGDFVCYSFYVSHIITTGSGGMICCDDKDMNDFIRSYISHGRVHGGDFTKHSDKWIDRFSFDKVGVSCRSDNLSASLGLSQLKRVEAIINKRMSNADILINRLYSGTFWEEFSVPDSYYWEDCIFQFFPILIKDERIDRKELLKYMYSKGIDTRVLLSLTNQPIVKKLYGDIEKDYPFSKYCNDNGFLVGCHQNLDSIDMHYIVDTIEDFVRLC